jgi:hypothetical protein
MNLSAQRSSLLIIIAHFKTVQGWRCDAVSDDDNEHKDAFVYCAQEDFDWYPV